MARVADYVIIADAWQASGGDTIKFTVPDNFHAGSRCVLNFMFNVWTSDDTTVKVSINGNNVWTWTASGSVEPPMRCIQEVVATDVVKAGENTFRYHASGSGYSSSQLSDIVLWFQGTA